MNRLTRIIRTAVLLLVCHLCRDAAQAQTQPLEIRQNLTNYVNFQSRKGVPLSSTVGTPAGSDGRAPTQAQQVAAGLTANPVTTNQFAGMMSFGAVPKQGNTNVNGTISFIANAKNIDWPRATTNSQTAAVLRFVRVGAPYYGQSISFMFGAIVSVPSTDENGVALPGNIKKEDYWFAEPHTTNQHANTGYYWSPNAGAVFAVQSGPVDITWKKANSTTTQPGDFVSNPTKYSLEGGNYYTLYKVRNIVSGSPVKPARKIYWTHGVFESTGKPVAVPSARVGAVFIVYNNNFPETVPTAFEAPGQSSYVTNSTNEFQEVRTLWRDMQKAGSIYAYNREGRVFVELLGDAREDGKSRTHLGFEIVDVIKQPNPADVTTELGERLVAFDDGRDDSNLFPEPVQQGVGVPFYYRHNTEGTDRGQFFATRETVNLNDVLVHWLEEGEMQIRWPSRFVRYTQIWPNDPSKYSHYVRQLVNSEAEAMLTAVPLPVGNVPIIEYQDPLDKPRAKLNEKFEFYTFLEPAYPAHRTLLRLTSGDKLAFERIFSWLDASLKTTNFVNTVATNLVNWNPTNSTLTWSNAAIGPRMVSQTINVGQRITAPSGELGANTGDSYLAGHLVLTNWDSYHPGAYGDPFLVGFTNANLGAIIPVNAIPGKNTVDVWWFRKNGANLGQGFQPIYWPAVIGRYTIQWPASPSEIIMANNAGSGPLASLQAKGGIYTQNDKTQPGFNPNEEHALMLGGQAYALRDDLNITTSTNNEYSSAPYVLVEYMESDSRPAVTVFKVLREKPSAGILFDYITAAGAKLQPPMPLPFLAAPVEGSGASAVNFNKEPPSAAGDLPTGWTDAAFANSQYAHYNRFTYKDRKDAFWVYRGIHAGLPALKAGKYNSVSNVFDALGTNTAVRNTNFTTYVHVSRQAEALTLSVLTNTPLPVGLSINGLTITGKPTTVGTNTVQLVIADSGDGSIATNSLTIAVVNSGTISSNGPITIVSTNQYAGTNVTYVGRPPFLAAPPMGTNSFTMRFYYKTLDGFAWPGFANPPAVGSIVPFLRPIGANGAYAGSATNKNTAALDIVYRPTWPVITPTMAFGDTLTSPKAGIAGGNLPAIRGQTSVQVLYQQSIGTNITTAPSTVVLHDSTREKSRDITQNSMAKLPGGVRTEAYQGKNFFPNLPPHLAKRLFFDPNRGTKGHLVFRGQFVDDTLAEDHLLLNVLLGTDLATVKGLCPTGDPDKSNWDAAIDAMSASVETFYENPTVPGQFIPNPAKTVSKTIGTLVDIIDDDTAVDSYALSAAGPGAGFVSVIVGNGAAFTPPGESVTVYIIKIGGSLKRGEVLAMPSQNPLNELLTLQHTPDLAGKFAQYEYDWRIAPPVDGLPLAITTNMTGWTALASGNDIPRFTLGGAGIQVLVDNYVTLRYRPTSSSHPLYNVWSDWTEPALAEGWIKRVLAAINPFNQRVTDLFNNTVNTDASILTQAGHRWEGDIALNLENINNYGLIEIYETILRRGKSLSVDAGINFGPANDALLLAAGYLNDLYMMLGNEASADAANPTIGIGTKNTTLGSVATALFAFKGQVASLLEEELALLRGRDDFLQPGVGVAPVYNRLFWNYTRGIDAGEVIYALNYDMLDQNASGSVDAADALKMYPQGHGDAYGHYLTALKGYYTLLMDKDFDWVPRIEAVTVLGKPISVDYLDERKFASAAAATARAGRQVFDLTWRKDYKPGKGVGWEHYNTNRVNTRRTYTVGGASVNPVRYWGVDHWATRVSQGAYFNWVIGNAILPDVDPDPSHEGIQKIDRTTVPELQELAVTADALQTSLDNAEGGTTPLGLPEGALAFDINPSQVTGASSASHFEQIYARAKSALNNAVVAFDDAKDVTRQMRSEQDTLNDLQYTVSRQELAYTNMLIEIYGTAYPEDVGPGKTYKTGYAGPDLLHFVYVDDIELRVPGSVDSSTNQTFKIDKQLYPASYLNGEKTSLDFVVPASSNTYTTNQYVVYNLDSHGFFKKPTSFVSKRSSPGKIQQAISDIILAHNDLYGALNDHVSLKYKLDRQMEVFAAKTNTFYTQRSRAEKKMIALSVVDNAKAYFEVWKEGQEVVINQAHLSLEVLEEALPQSMVFGLATGGDLASGARAALEAAGATVETVVNWATLAQKALLVTLERATAEAQKWSKFLITDVEDWTLEEKQIVFGLDMSFSDVQSSLFKINDRITKLDKAMANYRSVVAQGDRIQQEREIFRQRSAAIVQGYRTRDAGFRIFRNEKLERYKTLFDLASTYGFLAASAYDYETGLLNTTQGKAFVSRIINSRALGIIAGGEPQYAGSDTGDPGLSSAMAEMKADWDVLRGRLGFNNPDGYGTTASVRVENLRILPGTDGDQPWQDYLQANRVSDLLQDADVQRNCLQIARSGGLPVPGIVLTFTTTIADGYNLFGRQLAAGDHAYSPSSFATKIFGVGVSLEGYRGMDNPSANSSTVGTTGSTSPTDPTLSYLDPKALAATPYVYLIPVGVDSMRSPPLGDSSDIRTWSVDDVTIPLPFNIGGSDFSTKDLYQSSASLSEPIFSIRKHQSFRPVSTTSAFSGSLFGASGQLTPTQYTNRRLIGRSVWNSKWKLVIPGHTLLNDPNEGLDRFIQTVKDVRLYFITYSYSGN